MNSKPRVPDHLVHTCTACGRTYCSKGVHERWDARGHLRGSRGLCARDQNRLLRATKREPVPAHLVSECTACGREYVSSTTFDKYDVGGRTQGHGGMCQRDHERIKAHGAPITKLHKAEDVADEVAHLQSMGSSRRSAMLEVAQTMGMTHKAVEKALERARKRAAAQDAEVAA